MSCVSKSSNLRHDKRLRANLVAKKNNRTYSQFGGTNLESRDKYSVSTGKAKTIGKERRTLAGWARGRSR